MAERNAVAKRRPVETGPVMKNPGLQQRAAKKTRLGWCRFSAKGRCYVEGALLEAAEQEITLSPAGSYRARNNRNLELLDGEIPQLPEDAPVRPPKGANRQDREAFEAYEREFIDELEDGDPRVGAPPVDMKLIKQG